MFLLFNGLFDLRMNYRLTVVAQAGCVMQEQGITTPVFAAVSNGFEFIFFKISKNGQVETSQIERFFAAESSPPGSTVHLTLPKVLRWLFWIAEMVDIGEDSEHITESNFS